MTVFSGSENIYVEYGVDRWCSFSKFLTHDELFDPSSGARREAALSNKTLSRKRN